MHYLLLVTLTMPADATSSDTRSEVYSRLSEDDSFCGEGGRFGSPFCDWFVIGGRWSGHLTRSGLSVEYQQAIDTECPQLSDSFCTEKDALACREQLNALWHRFGGTDDHPYLRDSDQEHGYDDDARIIDRVTYDRLLLPYVGHSQDDERQFVDLDYDPLDESDIGRKWVVIIDYHS